MLAATKQILFSGTSTGLRDLTLANVITDGPQRADGQSVPGGLGVWPAATNLITNGGFETNTTGWVVRNTTETLSRITSASKFGGAAGNILLTPDSASEGAYHPFTGAASTAYTASVWVKPDSGVTARIYLFDNVGSFVGGDQVAGNGSTWTRLAVTATTGVGSVTFRAYVRCETVNANTKNIVLDGVQVETGSIATPYIETDGGTAARSEGSVQVAVQGLFTATQGWMAFAGIPRWTTAVPATNPRLFSWGDSTTNIIRVIYSAGAYEFANDATGGAAADTVTIPTTVVSGTPNIVVAKWGAADIGLSVDGSVFTLKGSRAEIPTIAATLADIGSYALTAARQFSGEVRWFLCGSGTPTNADAARMEVWRAAGAVPTLSQIAQLSPSSKPTLLIPADTSRAILLPAYFGGVL